MNGRLFLLAAAGAMLAGAPALGQPDLEASLRAADAQQRQAVTAGDAADIGAITHPNLLINAPTGGVVTRDQLLALVKSGAIGTTRFDRTIEQVRITGDVGVIMGREEIVPTSTSDQGRQSGAAPIQRRFTSVYLLESGKWLLLARHLNNVTPAAQPQP